MTINPDRIIKLYQPLCMMQLLKTDAAIGPIDGSYFGVPVIIGKELNKQAESKPPFGLRGTFRVSKTTYGTCDPGLPVDESITPSWGFAIQGTTDFNTEILAPLNGSLTPDVSMNEAYAVMTNSGSHGGEEVRRFDGVGFSYCTNPFVEWAEYECYSRQIVFARSDYEYLAKVDGMPYSFASMQNAQLWIDRTRAREAAAKPKTGAVRDKKILSVTAYREKINSQWKKAATAPFLSEAIRTKARDMLVREYQEVTRRLVLI